MLRSRQSLIVIVLSVPLVITILYILASITAPRSTTAQGTTSESIADIYRAALTAYPAETPILAGFIETTTAETHLELPSYFTPTPIDPQAIVEIAQVNTELASPAINPTYIVQRGDTLFTIAQRFNSTVRDIAAASGIVNINQLSVGQVLIIPRFTLTPTPIMVTVNITPLVLLTESPTPLPPTATDTPLPTLTPSPPPTNTIPPADTPQPITGTPSATEVPFTTNTPESLLDSDVLVSGEEPVATAVFISLPRGETTINGLGLDTYLVMDEQTQDHMREIFALGQTLGRNPHAFSKIGDSVIENPHFMDRFDQPDSYNLDIYSWLQPTIDWYRGSFSRDSVGVRVGIHSWSMFDPMWADPYQCESGETVLDCEIRLNNPSIMYIRLGSNDMGAQTMYRQNMRMIVEHALEEGIIPILVTKADRNEGSNINNDILREIAAEYQVPLWDFDLLAGTIPGRGVGSDGYHMTTFYAHDWSQPAAFQTGHGVHTLAGLIVLDAVWRVLYGGG